MTSPRLNVRSASPPAWPRCDWWWGGGLILAVLLAYAPVWRAGFVWDDAAMLTANPCIVGPLGLRQIWTTHFADICPLTLTVLWAEHAMWGLTPAPYHAVNVVLHAAAALLLWRVLRGWRVPGAFLGAALWALHPVEVESVAWVTEMKNTLSGVFFLGAVFFYGRWLDEEDPLPAGTEPGGPARRRWPFYGLCLWCAAMAMAAKSSTVVLPVILGLDIWWREGHIRWRRVINLGPVIVLAAVASALSLWTQGRSLILPGNAQWVRPWPDRLAAGGEAVWFYLGKLLWPHPLVAVYPRWEVHAGHALAWLPLLCVAGTLALLWRSRGTPWGRAGFLAFAYFLTALLPVLGWFDNTIFRYSLVFDHFQYLASMGPLALAGAGAARLTRLALPEKAGWHRALGVGALLVLGTLTWQRAQVYHDDETLWTDVVAKNPAAWIGHGNLGSVLLLRGQAADAQAHYEQALAINPAYAEGHGNLGVIFLRQGKTAEAIAQFQQALTINPRDVEAHSNLGNALQVQGQVDPAVAQYEQALAIDPDLPAVHFNLGNARYAKGEIDEAMMQYQQALVINPAYAEAHGNLGNAFLAKRQVSEAMAQYRSALAIRPAYAEAHNNLGLALLRTARFDEAVVEFQEALRLAPDFPNVRRNLLAARTLAQRAKQQ